MKRSISIGLCALIAACHPITAQANSSRIGDLIAQLAAKSDEEAVSNSGIRLGNELVAAAARKPDEIGDSEIRGLINLLARRGFASIWAANALSSVGPRAQAAVPVLRAQLKSDRCTLYTLGIWNGIHASDAYKDALEHITGEIPLDPTVAECKRS